MLVVGVAAISLFLWMAVKEKFAHFPPYRSDNFRSWPSKGISSLVDESGIPYSHFREQREMNRREGEDPKRGYDIFGAGYETLERSKNPTMFGRPTPEMPTITFSRGEERPGSITPREQVALRGNVERDLYSQNSRETNYESSWEKDGRREDFEKEGYIPTTRSDPVPREVSSGDFTQQQERRERDMDEQQNERYEFANPMAKDCSEKNPDAYPLWPVSYEVPFRDPLFYSTTTGLYTAANSDPENLKEQKLWPFAM